MTKIPASLVIQPQSRWPTQLAEATLRTALESGVPVKPRQSQKPLASIAVLTSGQLAFTKLCVASVLESCGRTDYELIIVDNASHDATPDYLQQLGSRNPQVRLIFNSRNRGFAQANNQALAVARGEILVLLNNDTLVAEGWLETLVRHLEDPNVGMVGPLTNRSGGETEIEASYRTYGEFRRFAAQAAQGALGSPYEVEMLPMLCAALRRDVWNEIGTLDESFQIGLFEDDDYCLRVRQAGYRLLCAADCYIHHYGQTSMGDPQEYGKLFERNRKRFENKWGRRWLPRSRRVSPAYLNMIEEIRENMDKLPPGNELAAVVSRGDEELLKLGRFPGRHFMECDGRRYAGHHPSDSFDAIARLRSFQREGARYLVLPETCAWWLDHYEEFRIHLQTYCSLALDVPGICRVYRLPKPSQEDAVAIGTQSHD